MVAQQDDKQVEIALGTLLRIGVLLSATVTAIGGGVYLLRHSHEAVRYGTFGDGVPAEMRNPVKIVKAVGEGSGRALAQLGLLLLIATPVARVIFSAFAFGRERDFTYVALTLFVLGVLLFSLFHVEQ